ncbi:copper-binding protein [uncultured Phenylobacterium sp.]|uniref:copper-binding protein n=1 Tax=uncultured Phenylobacterium sp. TaxID=349273 RepID=UPI0025CF1A79|nr:copper-binding protein [uncultured Phenylobacterium sp.]
MLTVRTQICDNRLARLRKIVSRRRRATQFLPLIALGGLAFATFANAHPGGQTPPAPPVNRRPSAPVVAPPSVAPKKLSEIEAVGVVRAIDSAGGRITISYEPIEHLNWPSGTMPFRVGKAALLNGMAVGTKVRFRLESQEITDLKPF